MHQPPTIPEGDEENEGVEQSGEGTHFPHSGAQQQTSLVPPIHDTTSSAAELQPREDEGVGYGHTPTVQNEMIAVSGDVPTDAAQQAVYDQPSSVEKPIIEDDANVGTPPATEAENEIKEQLDEGGVLTGITDEETADNEAAAGADAEKPVSTVVESPVPPAEDAAATTPRVAPIEEHMKPDEIPSVRSIFFKVSVAVFVLYRPCLTSIVDQQDLVEIVQQKVSENHHKCRLFDHHFILSHITSSSF